MKSIFMMMALMMCSFINASEKPFSQDRLIVKLKSDLASLTNIDFKKAKNLFGDVYVLYSDNVEQLYQTLEKHQGVVYVEKDYLGTKNKLAQKELSVPEFKFDFFESSFNDPKISKQWTLKSASSNGISINEFYSNGRGKSKETVIVAVVDTGVDYNHEDIPIWVNEGEIADNGIDDDNNGYIDDIHGINTLVRDSNGNATVNVADAHSHGTHVSGSIGAIQNNGIGIAGNASNVKIMAIRTVPNTSDERDVDVVEAFIYAARNGAKVINCSFGKDHNEGGQAVSEAIDYIGKKYGTLVVAAAGNSFRDIDSRPTYPASFENENLLVVASTTSRGGMSYFSNYGKVGVDLAAPGSGIYSTVPGNKYASMSGTSMAAPNTAGVAAEIFSRFPHLSAVQVKEILMNSVVKIGRFSNKIVSGGRVDLVRAMELAARY